MQITAYKTTCITLTIAIDSDVYFFLNLKTYVLKPSSTFLIR